MNNGRWAHDLYEARDNGSQTARDRFFQSRGFKGKIASGKIPFRTKNKKSMSYTPKYEVIVTNLHWNVTANDITQLASVVDDYRSVRMEYDDSGRFTGICTIRFDSLDSALLAVAKYNGRELDNRPMQWTLLPTSITPSSSSHTKSTIFDRLGKRPEERLGPRHEDPLGQNNKNIRENKLNRFRGRGKNYTSMDLDAEIDEYMNNDTVSNNQNSSTSQSMLKKLDKEQVDTISKQRRLISYNEGSVPVPDLIQSQNERNNNPSITVPQIYSILTRI